MRNLIRLALFVGLVGGTLSAATVSFTVTNLNTNNGLGQPLYRYIYNLTGAPLALNQVLDIRFEVTKYASLSNGVATPTGPTGYDLLLLQPNNPIGADGFYSLLAQANGLPTVGPFTVDFAYIGSGLPGIQTYVISQLNSQGQITGQVTSGFTNGTGGGSGVPEPATMTLGLVGLAMLGFARSRRR